MNQEYCHQEQCQETKIWRGALSPPLKSYSAPQQVLVLPQGMVKAHHRGSKHADCLPVTTWRADYQGVGQASLLV